MPPARARVPAIEGWFTLDDSHPQLIGTRCKACGTYFFPKESFACRNPRCGGNELEETPLSRRGKLWSFTDNRYPPPKPYVAPDPFEPYAVAAVELEREKMVVLGQVVKGVSCADLHAGMEMEIVLDALYQDGENDVITWKWRPCDA